MWFLRAMLWFDEGEFEKLKRGLSSGKPGYEGHWESWVLFHLGLGVFIAFAASFWMGVLYVWSTKVCLQSLIKKGFFDPLGTPDWRKDRSVG
jgi:hypothetical protein